MTIDIAGAIDLISLHSILLAVMGVIIGVVVGAIPGLTGSMAMAVALPFTLYMAPLSALGLLVGVYKGAMFGGAISAIAIGIPGTPSSAPTVFDGYPLAKKGKPKYALEVAHWSGLAADVFSDLVLILTFAPMALFALRFGPRELFAVMVVALCVLAVFATESIGRAIIGVGLGLLLATVGTDPIAGRPRLTFGFPELISGIGLIPLLIGMFAIPEIVLQWERVREHIRGADHEKAAETTLGKIDVESDPEEDHLSFREWLTYWRETSLGAVIGTVFGMIPGPGALLSTFTSYTIAGRFRRNAGTFGTGNPAGIAAAESADSATAGATLIPLFGLGIPGSTTAAVFAAALFIQGINPGPVMARNNSALVYAFFILMMIASLGMLLVVHWMIPLYARLLSVPLPIMLSMLMAFVVLGVWTMEVQLSSIYIMLGAGVLGLVCRLHRIPLAALLMSFIIGPLLEANFRRGALLARGDAFWWFKSPLAITLYLIGVLTIVVLLRVVRRGAETDTTGIIDEPLPATETASVPVLDD